jgi:hypothetical protein
MPICRGAVPLIPAIPQTGFSLQLDRAVGSVHLIACFVFSNGWSACRINEFRAMDEDQEGGSVAAPVV